MPNDETAAELRAAWDDLIASLQEARDAIDKPELMPAPATSRNLAEGYRYLMGFVHSAVERAFHEDPAHPAFRNALSIVNRATIDNADAIYFFAPIDGSESYRICGRAPAGDFRPPHYLIFETSAGVLAGDSGSLAELRPGTKARTGWLDSGALRTEPDGSFEILLAPERPEGHVGNFIPTRTRSDASTTRFANYISGRQLFNDWQHEDACALTVEPLVEPDATPPYGPEQAAAQLRRCGEIVRGQMHFWNAFWTILMGTYGHREGGIPGVEFSRNAFNRVNAASGATGGGMGTNLYAGGVFELKPDEALVIENQVPCQPQYLGFQLGNLWGESIEYANSLGSLNGHQCEVDPDGMLRLVVSHSDPGVPNWLDTTGHAEGFLTARWAYSETPDAEKWPTINARLVPFDRIREHLPPETRTVSADARREQVRVRQQHVLRRFRVF
jgi:hypothetical protein